MLSQNTQDPTRWFFRGWLALMWLLIIGAIAAIVTYAVKLSP
jgi:hypothetical protein